MIVTFLSASSLYEKPLYLPYGHSMCSWMCLDPCRSFSHALWASRGGFVVQQWPHGGTVASLSCSRGRRCSLTCALLLFLEPFYRCMLWRWIEKMKTTLLVCFALIDLLIYLSLDTCCSSLDKLRWQLKVKVLPCEPCVIVSAACR